MTRIVFICQEKGGVGKSLIARALAEAVPDAPLLEIDSTRRLVELEERTKFFPMRAERADIEKTGGKAARGEFDAVIDAVISAKLPTIVDVGANTSRSLLSLLNDGHEDLERAGIERAILVVVTADPGARAEAPRLMELAKSWEARFIVENRVRGPIDPKELKAIAGGATIGVFDEHVLDDAAVPLLAAGGLISVPRLDPEELAKQFGASHGGRIRRDLVKIRANAMEAVKGAAEWLVDEA